MIATMIGAILCFSSALTTASFVVHPHPSWHNQRRRPQGLKQEPTDLKDRLSIELSSVPSDVEVGNENNKIHNILTAPSSRRRRKFVSSLIGGSVALMGGLVANNDAAMAADGGVGGFLSGLGTKGGNDNGSTSNKRMGGPGNKIRNNVGLVMDELQRDLMQERWDLVEKYPSQLRSYVPVFTTYTDSAFPSDIPTDKGLRVALRYEVGRFFASVERLKAATNRRSLNEAYLAYADMALHFDRYMRVGGLYTYYDDTITNEPYFTGIADSSLVYSNPKNDPAEVRDLIILSKGPDKGKTGIVLAIYPDGSNNCVVKLDRIKGMREIKVVPRLWVAKRLGEQDPDDVFLLPRTNNGKRV